MAVFKFGTFCLNGNNGLTKAGQLFKIPPKELGVLRLLVENAGEIVSKEAIVNQVWHGGIVSDESLTRCIYMLRRRLGEGKEKKFIETVYGKGYCFVYPLETDMAQQEAVTAIEEKALHIALFPFHMHNRELSLKFHDRLSDILFGFGNEGISIIPSVLTRHCDDYKSVLNLLECTDTNYYIAGAEVSSKGQNIIRIELIDSMGHFILQREVINLTESMFFDTDLLKQAVIRLLVKLQPALKKYQLNNRLPFTGVKFLPLAADCKKNFHTDADYAVKQYAIG